MGVAWSWAGRRPAAGGTFRVGRNHPRERGTGRGWGEAWRLGLQTPGPRAVPAPVPGRLQGTLLGDLSETPSAPLPAASQLWRTAAAQKAEALKIESPVIAY